MHDRKKIVEAIRYVDRVVEQRDMNKVSTQKDLNYDVVFVGSDWKGTPSWNEYEKEYKKLGVDVVYLPHTDGISSTILKNKLENKE